MIQVQTGDIVYFRTAFKWHKPLAWLSVTIRFFAKIKYNHVGVVVMNWNKPFIAEAVGRGIICTPLDERLKDMKIVIKRPYETPNERSFAIEAMSYMGRPYDVIGLIWHQLWWNAFGVWIGPDDPSRNKKRFYCYEYMALLHRKLYPVWWRVKPKEVLEETQHTEVIYRN